MTAYGFRLFTVSAHPGRKHLDLDLSDLIEGSRAGSALTEMERHLRSIIDKPLFGRAAYLSTSEILPEDGLPDDADVDSKKYPHVRVTQVKVQGNRIIAAMYYGREGDYEWLLSQDGNPEPLGRRASANVYRVTFYFPANGTHAVMVSETRGRSHAGEVLLHWLRVLNQQDAVSTKEDGTRVETSFVRWSCDPFFDENRINDILDDSTDHVLTVKRKAVSSTNDRFGGTRRLTQHGLPVSRVDDLKTIIRKWWDGRTSRTPEERSAEAAHDVAALIASSEVLDTLDFNDGEVSFNENGKTQTITPNTIERLFVYPLGDSRPSDPDLLEAATTRIQPLLGPMKIDLELDAS